jgi:hypothetical protein
MPRSSLKHHFLLCPFARLRLISCTALINIYMFGIVIFVIRNGFGPETILLNLPFKGTCHFFVHL